MQALFCSYLRNETVLTKKIRLHNSNPVKTGIYLNYV